MSPIDIGGIVPSPPPPRDEDRDRVDRERDRARTDRDDRFLRAVRDTAEKGREKLAQQDAAAKRQSEFDAAQHDGEVRQGDRERTAAASDRPPEPESDSPNDRATTAPRPASDSDRGADSERSRRVAKGDVVGPEAGKSQRSDERVSTTEAAERGDAADRRDHKDGARVGRPKKGESEASAPVEAKATIQDPKGQLQPNAPAAQRGSEPGEGKIPRGIVRQAVEFAAFSERGGLMEFSLALGSALGGATMTLTALGNKKVAIRVQQRGAKGAANAAAIDEQDLAELVARLRQRGIDVAEVELC